MQANLYHAFGLTIQSDIPLDVLDTATPDNQPDIVISADEINANGLNKPRVAGLHFQVAVGEFWLNIPYIGRFYVGQGNQINYQLYDGLDIEDIVCFVTGICLGIVFHQRQLFVLHGCVIKIDQACMLILGNSGVGKSTLAAMFQRHHYPILSDELCVIDDKGLVHPGYPYLKLWFNLSKLLNMNLSQFKPIRKQLNKFWFPLKDNHYKHALVAKNVYIMQSWNKDYYDIQEIKGVQKFLPLQNHTYRFQYIDGLGVSKSNLLLSTKFANSVRLIRFTRPNRDRKVANSMCHIIEDFYTD